MGGLFHHDGPLMSALSAIGGMMMLSLLWCAASVPAVTLIPASAAMYHAIVKTVRGGGTGAARAFFSSFKSNLKQGIPLSLLCVAAALILYTCLDFGAQMSARPFGLAYLAIGLVLSLIAACVFMLIAPVLSRFDCGVVAVLRLSAWFALGSLPRLLPLLILGLIFAAAAWFWPPLLLFLPGLHMWTLSQVTEKLFLKYMRANGLLGGEVQAPAPEAQAEAHSAIKEAERFDLDEDKND